MGKISKQIKREWRSCRNEGGQLKNFAVALFHDGTDAQRELAKTWLDNKGSTLHK